MDSKENGLENQDSRVNVRSKIPYLKMDKIKETRAKLEEEKKKKEKVKSSKVVNYSNECCEKLKLSYV